MNLARITNWPIVKQGSRDEASRLDRERATPRTAGGVGGPLNELFPLPPEILDGREKDGFTYPVAMYDHDEHPLPLRGRGRERGTHLLDTENFLL